MDFYSCCKAIIANQDKAALNYAVSYAKAGLDIHISDEKAMKVQALYILNNMQYWRGDTAKKVRESLKALTGNK